MAKRLIAFGDLHIPQHSPEALAVLRNVVRRVKPDLAVCLGDVLDCGQFSTHPPTFDVPETEYEDDVRIGVAFLDDMQKHSGRLVLIEGNHEYRIDRWAAKTAEGKGAYRLLAPRLLLTRTAKGEPRKHFTYIRYGSAGGQYPHYQVNSRIIAVHGWSYARHATKRHLDMSQGRSVIHGHTHRQDASIIPSIWGRGKIIYAMSAGCLCHPVPLYGTGRPVEWLNAFILGYLGTHSDTLYPVPILGDHCVLPGGQEVAA